MYVRTSIYCKQGKICWAKLSRIPPSVVFHGKTFAVPYIYNTKTTPLYGACIIKYSNIHRKTFAVLLKTTEI